MYFRPVAENSSESFLSMAVHLNVSFAVRPRLMVSTLMISFCEEVCRIVYRSATPECDCLHHDPTLFAFVSFSGLKCKCLFDIDTVF